MFPAGFPEPFYIRFAPPTSLGAWPKDHPQAERRGHLSSNPRSADRTCRYRTPRREYAETAPQCTRAACSPLLPRTWDTKSAGIPTLADRTSTAGIASLHRPRSATRPAAAASYRAGIRLACFRLPGAECAWPGIPRRVPERRARRSACARLPETRPQQPLRFQAATTTNRSAALRTIGCLERRVHARRRQAAREHPVPQDSRRGGSWAAEGSGPVRCASTPQDLPPGRGHRQTRCGRKNPSESLRCGYKTGESPRRKDNRQKVSEPSRFAAARTSDYFRVASCPVIRSSQRRWWCSAQVLDTSPRITEVNPPRTTAVPI